MAQEAKNSDSVKYRCHCGGKLRFVMDEQDGDASYICERCDDETMQSVLDGRGEVDPNPELFDAMIAVAAAPPVKHDSSVTFAAKVPWSRIDRLRAALDAAGIEWRPVR